jgi:hypothetical protein
MATLDDLVFAESEAGAAEPQSVDDLIFAEAPPQPAPQAAPEPGGFSFKSMARNVPGSAVDVVTSTAKAVMNPIDTAEGMRTVMSGLIAKAIPGEQTGIKGIEDVPQSMIANPALWPMIPILAVAKEGAADPAIEFFDSRYGGKEQFLNTLENDPVGVLADAAGFMSATGGALRGTRAGAVLATAGRFSDPIGLGVTATRNAGRIMQWTGAEFYKRAAKFSTTIPLEVVDDATRQLLKNKLPIPAKAEKLRAIIATKGEELGRILTKADEQGVKISTKTILDSVDTVITEAEKAFGGKSAENLKILRRYRKEIAAQFEGRQTISPSELQASKIDISKDINFDKMTRTGSEAGGRALQDAMVAQRRQMNTLLKSIDDNIASINAELSPMLEIEPFYNQATRRIGNRNLLSNVVSSAAGGAAGVGAAMTGMGGIPAAATGIATAAAIELLRSPAVTSRFAIQLHNKLGIPMEAAGRAASNPFALSLLQETASLERAQQGIEDQNSNR